ncbi:MAG: PriCT-2 domain-containing protein [Bacteroidales bacterium]|nr:PriCT-2 domain-containing protein [Bacteroidales bacterium]
MTEVSIFENFNRIIANKPIEIILELIRTGKFKHHIDSLRQLVAEERISEYTARKKSLPAFTPSGMFNGGRKSNLLQEYSRIIILDIDKIENIADVRKKAESCKFTFACFESPSGKGIKILVRTDNSVTKHREAFLRAQSYYEKITGVKIDPSGKDVTRLCFVSNDPNLYYNSNCEIFKINPEKIMKNDVEKLIEQIDGKRIDITSNYEEWLKIGFALESEFGESGRNYYHEISKYNQDYSADNCNDQYNKCLKNNNSGISIKTLFHIAKQYGIVIRSMNKRINDDSSLANVPDKSDRNSKITSNKFIITEDYLSKNFDLRYNVISNKFEYKKKDDPEWLEMNENNMFIQLQKDNINISLNHLIALLKSDFVQRYHVFRKYFESLPEWDGSTDYILKLTSFLITNDRERLEKHFKKWLVRAVKTAIDDHYFNKQAFVLVSTKQNSGKSTFCRFLCPTDLKDYITESISTDKDSMIAITENFLINLDELSQADKAEINAFKSMFSKDKVKARLTYDKRPTVHSRRASFIGSTDRWEFLTDENGSVRWLCFEIESIDWNYTNEIDIDDVWSQAYHLLTKVKFEFELTPDEIKENDYINKKYQVSTPERDLVMKFFAPADEKNGEFKTATDLLEYISERTSINLSPIKIGKELRFLGFERVSKRAENSMPVYGYYVRCLIDK